MKVVALVLGPAGVGLIGTLGQVLGTLSTAFSLGLPTSGVRYVNATSDPSAKCAARAAVRVGLWFAGTFGALLTFAGAGWLSRLVFDSGDYTFHFRLLALGVLLSSLASSETVLLQSARKVAALSLVNVIAGVASLGVVLPLVLIWELDAMSVILLATPFATWLAGLVAVRLSRLGVQYAQLRTAVTEHLWPMLKLGAAVVASALIGGAVLVFVRSQITRDIGLEASGHFQAAWVISMTYIGFVLSAMTNDFYPRLSESAHDPSAFNKQVSDQIELTVLLGGPALLGTYVFAEAIVRLLYSSEFDPAVSTLRWQLLGDAIKLMAWPLGFILLSLGKSLAFLVGEILWNTTYLVVVMALMPRLGLDATGMAFLAAYLMYLLYLLMVARRLRRLRISARTLSVIAVLASCTLVVFAALRLPELGRGVAIGAFLFLSAWSVVALLILTGKLRPLRSGG